MLAWVDAAWHELLLFAAVGVLLGGIDDLAVDFIFWGREAVRRLPGGAAPPWLGDYAAPAPGRRFAVFVPAWDESGVIAPMLRLALTRLDHPGCTLFVGCYPNDRATIAAVAAVAAGEPRVRLVIGGVDGPTTKADCLNTLWGAFEREEGAVAAAGGEACRAVILHDAEDVVHPGELPIFDALIGAVDLVQLPVLPLVHPRCWLVSGVVADEFAESHAKLLVVRELVGAGMPLAGVGCAIAVPMLRALARAHDTPFDPASLTEDYELGLRVAALGGRATFAQVAERPGGAAVAVREYFPATLAAAVRQKARWMAGIALAGWDRTGWGRPLALGDHWMRMRDRRPPLAMVVLAAAYLTMLLWGGAALLHWIGRTAPPPLSAAAQALLSLNAMLLAWRLVMRAYFTRAAYGWREAARSVPRLLVGNLIALLAARRALWLYAGTLRGSGMRWEKTAHAFPAEHGGDGPPGRAVSGGAW